MRPLAANESINTVFGCLAAQQSRVRLSFCKIGLSFYGEKQKDRDPDVGRREADHHPISNFRAIIVVLCGLVLMFFGCTSFYRSGNRYVCQNRGGWATTIGFGTGFLLFSTGFMIWAFYMTVLSA